jgi:hypothetical protein
MKPSFIAKRKVFMPPVTAIHRIATPYNFEVHSGDVHIDQLSATGNK